MSTNSFTDPTTKEHENDDQEMRRQPIMTSWPLVYTKDGKVIAEWVDGGFGPDVGQDKRP